VEDRAPAPFGWMRAAEAGLTFRAATEADLQFLSRLYASTRLDELAVLPWSSEQKAAFLELQFRAQHADYQRNYPDADRLVLEHRGEDIGRPYLRRESNLHGIIDIALLPEHRGKGLGAALLRDLLDEAARAGKPVSIHVEKFNPAKRLYHRLGFKAEEEGSIYDLMRWDPVPA
jgi:GNAT superfamily N-acetyltransferase